MGESPICPFWKHNNTVFAIALLEAHLFFVTFRLSQFNLIALWLTILAQNVLPLKATKEKACVRDFPPDLVYMMFL